MPIMFGRKHREAFALMKYRNKSGDKIEWIWNSRDGVTPFSLLCAGADLPRVTAPNMDNHFLQHADWGEDALIPNFVPPIGSRIFVDHTMESLTAAYLLIVPRYIEQDKANNTNDFLDKYGSIEAGAKAIAQAEWREGMPCVRVVDEGMHEHFKQRALTDPWVRPPPPRPAAERALANGEVEEMKQDLALEHAKAKARSGKPLLPPSS